MSTRSSGQPLPNSGQLPCYTGPGRGGARPGAGRPSNSDPRTAKRKRKAERQLQERSPKVKKFTSSRPRLQPRGALTTQEVEKRKQDLVYNKLLSYQQLAIAQSEGNTTLQDKLSRLTCLNAGLSKPAQSAASGKRPTMMLAELLTEAEAGTAAFSEATLRLASDMQGRADDEQSKKVLAVAFRRIAEDKDCPLGSEVRKLCHERELAGFELALSAVKAQLEAHSLAFLDKGHLSQEGYSQLRHLLGHTYDRKQNKHIPKTLSCPAAEALGSQPFHMPTLAPIRQLVQKLEQIDQETSGQATASSLQGNITGTTEGSQSS